MPPCAATVIRAWAKMPEHLSGLEIDCELDRRRERLTWYDSIIASSGRSLSLAHRTRQQFLFGPRHSILGEAVEQTSAVGFREIRLAAACRRGFRIPRRTSVI